LRDLRQEGCLKARFPRPAGWTEAVTLNTSGGCGWRRAEIPRWSWRTERRRRSRRRRRSGSTRALPDDAASAITTRVGVGAGARAEWLPQDTILFDRWRVLAPVVRWICRRMPGSWAWNRWCSGGRRWVRRCGRRAWPTRSRCGGTGGLILHDAIRLSGRRGCWPGRAGDRARRRGGGNAGACGPGCGGPAGRAAGGVGRPRPAEAGASAWDGMLVGRIVARAGAAFCVRRFDAGVCKRCAVASAAARVAVLSSP